MIKFDALRTYVFTIAITGYVRSYRVGRNHPRYQRPFLSMGLLVLLLLTGLAYYNFTNALFIFMIPMLTGYLITCWHTYYHHAGLGSDNHYEASFNIMHKWYNHFTGNLGYHTAHHLKQGLHWSLLPSFHKEIENKIPPELFQQPPIPFRWLPDS